MAIKEDFSETRHSNYYGESKKSKVVTSFEAISRRNRFSNAFSGLQLSPTPATAIVLACPAVVKLKLSHSNGIYSLLKNIEYCFYNCKFLGLT